MPILLFSINTKVKKLKKVNDYFISNNILNTSSTFQIGDGEKEDDNLEITK